MALPKNISGSSGKNIWILQKGKLDYHNFFKLNDLDDPWFVVGGSRGLFERSRPSGSYDVENML